MVTLYVSCRDQPAPLAAHRRSDHGSCEGVAQPICCERAEPSPRRRSINSRSSQNWFSSLTFLGCSRKACHQARKPSPRLALDIGGFVELVEVGQETRNSGDTENAADDTGPPLEEPSGRDQGLAATIHARIRVTMAPTSADRFSLARL